MKAVIITAISMVALLALALIVTFVWIFARPATPQTSATTALAQAQPLNVNVGTTMCGDMPGGAASMNGPLPVYPRATDVGSMPEGTNGGIAHELITDDTYEQVYKWYKSKMPPASERHQPKECGGIKMPASRSGEEFAIFSVGALGKDYRGVFIVGIPRDAPNARIVGWPKGKPLPRTIIMQNVP